MNVENFTINFKLKNKIKNIKINNKIVISFCTSNLYAPYCGIAIESIIQNSSIQNNYEIYIMEYDISIENKRKILNLIKKHNNFSIFFINMKEGLKDIKVNTWAHFSPVACLKLFLFSDVFEEFDKILALDTDLVFCRDVADLYCMDINDNAMAAVDDFIMKTHLINNKFTSGFAPKMPLKIYLNDYLNFGTTEKYFNTGVALFNLKFCRKIEAFKRAITKLQTKGYVYQEQDVINELFYHKTVSLDHKWNVIGTDNERQIRNTLIDIDKDLFIDSIKNPYIIHYAGGLKPWNYVETPYSEYFYKYARNTEFYELIMMNLVNNKIGYINKNLTDSIYVNTSFRMKIKNILKKIFPINTKRGNLIRKMFPKGKGIRKIYFDIYKKFFLENRVEKKLKEKRENEILKKNNIYHKSLSKEIQKSTIMLDSKNGTDIAGNIFRIIVELHKSKYQIKIYLTYTDEEKYRIKNILSKYSLTKVNLVEFESEKYFELLARAQYIATDLYVPSQYVKRDGQILISTAHGTPIKVMGKYCHTETQGHLQRTHTLADYQTFSSDYMKEKLFGAFMEDNLSTGHLLKSGYCRNDIFFNKTRRELLRKELGFNNKKVFAYLPTFRGIGGNFESIKQVTDITKFCDELDDLMKEDEVLLVKFHNFVKNKMNFTKYHHIHEFPNDYEVYDVLNATDGLISDYSSVFFDYANTRNKIILFQYDFEEYSNQRGVYLNWNDLPFPIVDNIKDLYREMVSPKNYDDSLFIKKYCTYDSEYSTEKVCQTIFLNEKNRCNEFKNIRNNKKNILIFAGNFDLRNRSTYLVQEYLKYLSKENKNNYFLYFYEYDLFSRAYILEKLPDNISYFSFLSYPDLDKKEKKNLEKHKFKNLDNMFKRECKKCFADIPIDLYIDLFGENMYVAEIAKNLNCKKIILDTGSGNISADCLSLYDKKIKYVENSDINNELCNNKIIYLKSGISEKDIKKNAKILERLCD